MTEAAVSFAGNLTDDPELRHMKLRHSVTFTACCPATQGLDAPMDVERWWSVVWAG